MQPTKKLQDLTLLDRFLFAETMEDPDSLTSLLEIVLNKDLTLAGLPQTEKELRVSNLHRQVKLDVWGKDTEGNIYDTEPQKRNTHNIPKRSRHYQSMIDVKLLEPGDIDFNKLNNVFIIMIAPFDLFGLSKYVYTFRMSCDEAPGLSLDDGAVRIFLNTHGTNDDEVNPELVELLHYIEHTTEYQAEQSSSVRIKRLQDHVKRIKSNAEIGVRYMQAWEEKVLDRREAYAEGEARMCIRMVTSKMEKYHVTAEEACNMLDIPLNEYQDALELISKIENLEED